MSDNEQTDVTIVIGNKPICKYNKFGYCKYKMECKFVHKIKICEKNRCEITKCKDRHPKQCRFNLKCRRRLTCMFKHEIKVIDQLYNIKEEMKKKTENLQKKKKI